MSVRALRPGTPLFYYWHGKLRRLWLLAIRLLLSRPSSLRHRPSNLRDCQNKRDFPPGVINVVTGFGAEAGDALVRHKLVRKVAFTGGEAGGVLVNTSAAQDFKRVTLELGGKSANIVFDDANLDQAVNGAISGIFAASGQTCIAGSRLLLQDSIHDAFLERLVEMAAGAQIGDPMSADTQVGPITTEAQYRKILDYIEIAKGEGARCVLGGGAASAPAGSRGLFVQPTIFADVTNDMRIAQEEVFGPVLSVLRFSDEDQAVEIANDVNYGLAAGVWTEGLRRAITMAERLEAGTDLGQHLSIDQLHNTLWWLQGERPGPRKRC